MNILEISNLKKSYHDLTAVNGINLAVGAGEIHGILGPNGAGKSTTMNCILGLLPYEGKITFAGGKSIKEWNKNVGYVPQDLAIYPELTPTENIRFFCALYGFKGGELKERVAKALDFVGLTDVKDKKAGEFSGGMKRRLNMACGIAHSPKLIIMDEPTVGIDPQSRNRIMENVRELNRQGATVLYTTHYMPEVEEICSRITVIDHGSIVAEGTKDEIMHKAGMSDASMEQIFLQLTGTELRD
ncbi:MAG: ABC transporter ATP-binding protein [bacterium]|nr:ABC transporter ATP-binding protein [bacterium]